MALLELNRPKAKNALNEELLTAFNTELDAIRTDDEVRAVVLAGTEGVFCAGAGIGAFDKIRADPLLGERAALGGNIWADLGTFPKPVIAAMETFALGGGCELALACDIVISGQSAKFGVPEVKLGVIPGGGGTKRLIQAVGKSKAMAMLLTGDFISAEQACSAGALSPRSLRTARPSRRRWPWRNGSRRTSPIAFALAKDAALRSLETSLSQGLEHEKRNFHVAVHSADSHEGQAAFLEKRAPQFTGSHRGRRGYPFDCPARLASVEALRLPPRLVGGR